jgi:hypothetical protein
MTNYKSIPALVLFAAIAIPAVAATGYDSITKEQIAAAMSGAGMRVSAEQVMLLSDVVASTNTPGLKVESMERWGADRMRVRLDCAKREDCLPFYVAVRLTQGDAGSGHGESPSIAKTASTASYVIRAGSSAILLLDGGHVHIRVPVVCLENGTTGQTIRVSSKDRHLTYTAQVVDGTILRGSL